MRYIYLFILLTFLSGCSLWPKRVEYFQDKVQKVPAKTEKYIEAEKEAADYLYAKTHETVNAAIKENSSTNVLKPAIDSERVANSLSDSLGKPLTPFKGKSEDLVAKIDRLQATLDKRIEDFRDDNDKNAGKKIEGSGAFSIGYFTQFIILGGLVMVGWVVLKVIGLFNPAISVGSQVLSGGMKGVSKVVSSGFSQLISAGESFKQRIDEQFEDPETKEKILDLFKRSHLEKQSPEVQEVIKKLTNTGL